MPKHNAVYRAAIFDKLTGEYEVLRGSMFATTAEVAQMHAQMRAADHTKYLNDQADMEGRYVLESVVVVFTTPRDRL